MASAIKIQALTVALGFVASGCIIVDGRPGGGADDDLGWYDDDGGTGGGGAGTGAGGSGAGVGSGGGGGDDLYCVDEIGTGQTDAVCDGLAALTCDGEASLAYASCVHGFHLYEAGPAEALAACLQAIPASESCEVDPVATCVEEMYDDACVFDFNADACAEWANDCSLHGESLDYERCAFELNPYNFDAMVEMVECMNATDGLCQDRYDVCFEESLTF